MADNPNTLPADFFTKKAEKADNPDVLPADFFSSAKTPDKSPVIPVAAKAPEGSAVSRAAGGFWDTTVGGLKQGAKMAVDLAQSGAAAVTGGFRPPSEETRDALKGIAQGHVDQAKKAKGSWSKPGLGNKVEAVGHGMAAALPLLGPAAAHAGERIGGEKAQYDKFGNVVKPQQLPDVAGGLGEAAGLIVASSPENVIKPVAKGVAAVAKRIPIPERLTPEGLYQSSLRPSLAKKNLPKVKQQVATGLNERIPVDARGLRKADATIDSLNDEITDKLQGKSDELGPVISPEAVAQRTASVPEEFDTVNPEADMKAIAGSRAEFLRKHQTEHPYTKIRPGTDEVTGTMVPEGSGVNRIEKPLTLLEAQAEKQKTYGQLRKKYGELGSAEVETQKNLARGLKEEIVKRVPELSALNAREGALIDLQSQLEKMVAREGNKNILGLVPATMSHNPFGFLATLMMDNPAIKSRIAIALHRARGLKVPSLARPASGAMITGNAADLDSPAPIQ